jgi:hypothetical protein
MQTKSIQKTKLILDNFMQYRNNVHQINLITYKMLHTHMLRRFCILFINENNQN